MAGICQFEPTYVFFAAPASPYVVRAFERLVSSLDPLPAPAAAGCISTNRHIVGDAVRPIPVPAVAVWLYTYVLCPGVLGQVKRRPSYKAAGKVTEFRDSQTVEQGCRSRTATKLYFMSSPILQLVVYCD